VQRLILLWISSGKWGPLRGRCCWRSSIVTLILWPWALWKRRWSKLGRLRSSF